MLIAKFRLPEVFAMETVTHYLFFFNDQYLSRGSSYWLEILVIKQWYILCSEHNFPRLTDFLLWSSRVLGRVLFMSLYLNGALISLFFIYNSRTRSRI